MVEGASFRGRMGLPAELLHYSPEQTTSDDAILAAIFSHGSNTRCIPATRLSWLLFENLWINHQIRTTLVLPGMDAGPHELK